MKMSEEDLISSFEFIGEHPSSIVIKKCMEICSTFGIDAEELIEYWSAFNMTYLKNVGISLENIVLLEQRVLNNKKSSTSLKENSEKIKIQKEKSQQKTTSKIQDHKSPDDIPHLISPKEAQLEDNSSRNGENVEEQNSEISEISYAQRSNSEKVVASFGKKCNYTGNEQLLNISIYGDSGWYKPNNFTSFYTTQARIANSFDKRIEDIGQMILKKHHLTASKNEDSVIVYGRIKSEDRNKVNNRNVILETSRDFNGPREITLNITNAKNYSIFSGQIVAVRGIITSRNTFIVQELYTDASGDFLVAEPSCGENIQIMVAAGPFTMPDNFLYEPLQDLLKRAVEQKPNVLILIGPFIDTSHPNLLTMTDTFEDHFEILIKNIMECLVGWPIQVILIPSASDAHHCPVFPTPSEVLNQSYQNLICSSNPCLLNIDGFVIGTTSLDILFQLTKAEVSRNARHTDRMSRLASHLINQRSFYPLYPNRDPSLSVDYECLLNDCSMDVKPHLLILPSTLRYFIKCVDNCVVINPERLVKNYVGGTYAVINVALPLRTQFADCISCEIKNI